LAVYTHQDAIRISTPAVAGEFTIVGPNTHSLAGQFVLKKYPGQLAPGPVFPEFYISPAHTPVIEAIQPEPPNNLKGLGRPLAFSAPGRTIDHLWFLLEGAGFAVFIPQARFCQYKADMRKGVLHFVFHREVFRITPLAATGEDRKTALERLLNRLDVSFPPCDAAGSDHHVNTLSVYAAWTVLPPWANHDRHLVAAIEQVDAQADRSEWEDATTAPTQAMVRNQHARHYQDQVPEFSIPGLKKQLGQDFEQDRGTSHEMGGP
jgi:hypothetical protein